jgi:tetratricopeptide (TPR) repeat protein
MAIKHLAECPTAEEFATYADGGLGVQERDRVERHLVECGECRAVLIESAVFATSEPSNVPSPQRLLLRSRWMPIAASLVAAAALAIVVVRMTADRDGINPRRPELQGLVAALNKSSAPRLTEGRLTGGFTFGPRPTVTRSRATLEVSPEVRIQVATIEREARSHPSVANDAALGVAYLVNGDVDEAVNLLERASAAGPGIGAYWSDLSAAYLARATQSGSAADVESARRAAERALTVSPNMPEAAFNLALALEQRGDTAAAAAAWKLASGLQESSQWAAEAEARARAAGQR